MDFFYFDHHGQLHTAMDGLLVHDLHSVLPKSAWADYLATNMGVVIASTTPRAVHIKFRPSRVGELPFFSMLMWLSEQRADRVVVHTHDEAWRTKIIGGGEERTRLALLAIYNSSGSRPERKVLHSPRATETLPFDSPLRAALRYWVDVIGRYDATSLRRVATEVLGNRYALIKQTAGTTDLRVKACGEHMPSCAKEWLSAALGRRLDEQPDIEYARYCSQVYLRAASHGAPLLDDVDAIVAWPGYNSDRRRYRRIILPFDDASGDVYLLSASFVDNSIDLRRRAI
ncbi:MAG: hypothetical protein ACKVP7_04315 [Hyphomicrobiaceae bacterium]